MPLANASAGWMTPAECLAMRIPDLGVSILRRLRNLGEEWRSSQNFVEWTVDGNDGWFSANLPIATSVYTPGSDRRAERDRLKAHLQRAWTWLENQGYVVPDHGSRGGNWKLLTPDGEAIMNAADADEALKRVRAAAQLNIDLHPRLQAAGVQPTFRSGDLDSAIRDAFADLEDAVRTLGAFSTNDFGVNLMTAAFAKNGPLAPGIDPKHLTGYQRSFEGAFSILRNPAGHGPTGLDVEEAVEEVLHADLLMRKLDRVAQKLGKTI